LGGTPAIVLGTAAAAGVATTFLRDDDTILAFGTTPATQAFGDSAVIGTDGKAANALHKHAMMSSPLGLPLALTGSVAATRYVGGTTSGAPASGTFAVGDFVIDQTGVPWVCTGAGTPGTWAEVGLTPDFRPADHNLIAWNFDSQLVTSGSTALATAGTVYTVKIPLRRAASITNILLDVGTAGATLTSGQCFAALYQGVAGALLGVTAEQHTNWQSTGVKPMALAGGPFAAAAGMLIVAFWFNGTTGPSLGRLGSLSQSLTNVGLAAAQSIYGTADTGITTTAPNPVGTIAAAANSWWVALS
jgi:hypothetical protein